MTSIGSDRAPQPPRMGRALAIRFGAMGDMVQMSAALANISERHARVDVLGNGGASAAVLAGTPGLGRVLPLSHRWLPMWLHLHKQRVCRLIERRKYEAVYAFDDVPGLLDQIERSGTMVHRCFACAAPRLHGLASDAWVLAQFGIPSPQTLPTVNSRPADAQVMQARLRELGCAGPVVVFQPGNSRTLHPLHRFRPKRNLKAWPVASWAAVAEHLLTSDPMLSIAIAGAPSETATAQAIHQLVPVHLRSRVVVLTQELPVARLAGLLSLAIGCISVDTGPAHLAAALGCPLVVLFGPADPDIMAPAGPGPVAVLRSHVACSPCYGTKRRHACQRNICMEQISVTQVMAAWASTTKRTRLTG